MQCPVQRGEKVYAIKNRLHWNYTGNTSPISNHPQYLVETAVAFWSSWNGSKPLHIGKMGCRSGVQRQEESGNDLVSQLEYHTDLGNLEI